MSYMDCNLKDLSGQKRICWFCKKGRHKDCMQEIAVESRSAGPHDCTFDSGVVFCQCVHKAVPVQ